MKPDPLSGDLLTSLFRTSNKDPLRIINREGSTIEFKESYNHAGMAQYFKTMASFANNAGGYIIFGVADKPRRLVGLQDKYLEQFENIKIEEVTKNLTEYFSPAIKWNTCTFEYKGMSFGVFYTYPLDRKPCICKKAYDSQNPKYTLREGDIYYRYGGRSERIHYEELSSIIETERKNEEHQWIEFVKKAAKIGIENTCLLDLESGIVGGKGGTIVIDDELLSKLSFIKEGEFVEIKGSPTLRLIGDVQEIETGKVVVKETTKRVVKAIEANDIITDFLLNNTVEEPIGYIRRICSELSANYPLYYYIMLADGSIDDTKRIIEETTSRNKAKQRLLDRISGKLISQPKPSSITTYASEKKEAYRQAWIEEQIIVENGELLYCLSALQSLSNDEIKNHDKYIRRQLLNLYNLHYEQAKPLEASELRKAICRVDEALYYDSFLQKE